MLASLLALVPGLFTTISGITNAITNEKINLAQSQNEADRIASQERITALQARRDVMLAESGTSKINGIIRAMIGGSVALYLGKIFIIDKVFGFWTQTSTDPLDSNLWKVVTATIAFYFLYEGAVNATRIIKS